MKGAQILMRTVFLLYLSGAAFVDVRTYKVSVRGFWAAVLPGILFLAIWRRQEGWGILYGFLPGILLLLLSNLTGGGIGKGDGMILLSAGLYLSLPEVAGMAMAAFLSAFLFSCVLFMAGKRFARIPFLPFLLFGYVIALAAQI